ncbi:hypothetical protein [Evansella clarkii]|nr:hypothetical protein [Evansella clarkii]
MKKLLAKVLVIAALGAFLVGGPLSESAGKMGDMPRPHSTFQLM